MAQEADNQYEASDESSENELLDRSLSVWKGWNWNVKDVFDPIPLDLHTASSIGQYDVVRSYIARYTCINYLNHHVVNTNIRHIYHCTNCTTCKEAHITGACVEKNNIVKKVVTLEEK